MFSHDWTKDEDGNEDDWAWADDEHHGPECTLCHLRYCVQCWPDGPVGMLQQCAVAGVKTDDA